MKKVWSAPMVEDLAITATAMQAKSGTVVDGTYDSTDGRYHSHSFSGGSDFGYEDYFQENNHDCPYCK